MEYKLLLMAFLTHCIIDFPLQNNKIIYLRYSRNGSSTKENLINILKGNVYHCLLHCVALIIFFFLASFITGQAFQPILIAYITLSHLIIDICKSIIIYINPDLINSICIFLIDQGLHIISIYIIICGFEFKLPTLDLSSKLLLAASIYTLCTYGAGNFIRLFINSLNKCPFKALRKSGFIYSQCNNTLGVKNGGYYIGILERSFIILIIAAREPSMLGFVLAAKSIARFKKLEEDSFAEYFIIGTFLSFIIAIIGGVLIGQLNILPTIK